MKRIEFIKATRDEFSGAIIVTALDTETDEYISTAVCVNRSGSDCVRFFCESIALGLCILAYEKKHLVDAEFSKIITLKKDDA